MNKLFLVALISLTLLGNVLCYYFNGRLMSLSTNLIHIGLITWVYMKKHITKK